MKLATLAKFEVRETCQKEGGESKNVPGERGGEAKTFEARETCQKKI